MAKVMSDPITDPASMLERYMEAAQKECLVLPGHESECQCVNHVQCPRGPRRGRGAAGPSEGGLMPSVSPERHPRERPGREKRTPVQIDPDTYDAVRRLAVADDRTVARYVNRVLKEHARKRGAL